MVNLLPRTEYERIRIRVLWQQADIGRLLALGHTWPFTPTSDYNCYYCRYKQTFTTEQDFLDCSKKHACNFSAYPFIQMGGHVSLEADDEWLNPDGTTTNYVRTGIYRQTQFEAQPHHIELCVINHNNGQCNAACWWHAWRLANQRTWRQCGATHLCQNNGSLWLQVAPSNAILYQEFIQQL